MRKKMCGLNFILVYFIFWLQSSQLHSEYLLMNHLWPLEILYYESAEEWQQPCLTVKAECCSPHLKHATS